MCQSSPRTVDIRVVALLQEGVSLPVPRPWLDKLGGEVRLLAGPPWLLALTPASRPLERPPLCLASVVIRETRITGETKRVRAGKAAIRHLGAMGGDPVLAMLVEDEAGPFIVYLGRRWWAPLAGIIMWLSYTPAPLRSLLSPDGGEGPGLTRGGEPEPGAGTHGGEDKGF